MTVDKELKKLDSVINGFAKSIAKDLVKLNKMRIQRKAFADKIQAVGTRKKGSK